MDKYIRFDWAAKRMLRNKANFGVLEGLMTVLLDEKVTIVELLESEGNQEAEDDKFNRVDIKAKNSKGEIILVEIQQTRELYYLQRILYGVAKAITEHIKLGNKYDQVKKVYSISIVYFDLGKGADYLYHGQNQLIGVHTKDQLVINTRSKDAIGIQADYLRSTPLHKSQSEGKSKHGEFAEFTYRLCVTPELVSQLLAIGDKVEVLEPEELREEMKKRINNMFNFYK